MRKLTRFELLSTHHLLLLAEWFTVPARVVMIELPEDSDVICNSPGPSLRLICWARTVSPGSTMDEGEDDMIGRLR